MNPAKFNNTEVVAIFEAYPEPIKTKLMALRKLIMDTASCMKEVGALEETLKWGQPSYLTSESKSGSTIRIDQLKSQQGRYAMYFNCRTSLVDTFRQIYPDEFEYDGNRAIVFDVGDELPVEALKDCISAALTYHANKK